MSSCCIFTEHRNKHLIETVVMEKQTEPIWCQGCLNKKRLIIGGKWHLILVGS